LSNDERPESLAAQAAAWVPPWERPRSDPDRDYQAAHRAAGADPDGADPEGADPESAGPDGAESDGAESGAAGSDGTGLRGADVGGAGLGGAGDVERVEADVEKEVRAEQLADLEGADYDDRPDELRPDDDEDRSGAGLSDDDDDFDSAFEGGNPPGYEVSSPGAAVVDQPHELPGEDEPEPTEVHLGDEVPLPGAVEEAAEAGEDEGGAPVDAPLPADGDDAGDVFDAAADDDVSDDDEVDLPFTEVVPATDDDEDAALAADEAEFRRAGEKGRLDGGVGGLGDEASAYAAGAADALDELRGAARRPTADGHDPGEARPADGLAAESLEDGERAEAGSAVPVQGRRRRSSSDASGEAVSRTSGGGEAVGGGAAVAVSVATPALEAEVDREAEATALPALEDDAELASALEAIMLVVDEPVGELQLA
jgi:segregation and condensation protein B